MSVQATAWVWAHSTAEGTVRLVALALADAANAQGRGSCQSVTTVAAMCKISERSVQRALRALEDAGEIASVGQSKRYRTTVYDFPKVARMGDSQGGVGDSHGSAWVTATVVEGDTPVTRSHIPQRATPVESAAPAEQAPAAAVAKALYDQTQGALPFMGMRTIASWAISTKHAEPDAVTAAGLALYKAGKPVTKVTVAQVLDGALRIGPDGTAGYSGSMSRAQQAQGVLERGMARAQAYDAQRPAVGW